MGRRPELTRMLELDGALGFRRQAAEDRAAFAWSGARRPADTAAVIRQFAG
jgi:hypothetical protein